MSSFDAASNVSGKSQALSFTTTDIDQPDTLAPSIPTGLTVAGSTNNSVNLIWTPSSDNVGVAGYIVYVDGNGKGDNLI